MGHPEHWAACSVVDGSPLHCSPLHYLWEGQGSVETAEGTPYAEARICSVLFERSGGLAMFWELPSAHSVVAELRKVWMDCCDLG